MKYYLEKIQNALHLGVMDTKFIKFSFGFALVFSIMFGLTEYYIFTLLDHSSELTIFLATIASNFILCLLFACFKLYFFKSEFSVPLKQITKWVLLNSHPGSKYRKLELCRSEDLMDELDICTSAINTMNSNLFQSHLSLKKHHENLESKVEKKTAKIRSMAEERRGLIRILCHDIANFLTTIDISTSMIEKNIEITKKPQLQCFEKMCKATTAIKSVLESVKDMEAVSLGTKKINLQHISLAEVISDTLFHLKDQIELKLLKIRLDNKLEENDLVIADPSTLSHQVLVNILSNAIKFSEMHSQIHIIVSKNANQTIRVTVKDSGEGIPKDQISNLFRLDFASSRKGTAGELGTGFGIPIAKTVVEKFGGRISVESKCKKDFPEDHGSSFHIDLRRAA